MIKMTIHHGEEVQQRDLSCDFLSLRMSLYQMNLMLAPNEVSVRDVQAEFTSTDPIGQKLISLIRPGDLLSDVDVAIHQLKAAPQAIQEAMRQRLLDGAFETIEDIHIGRDQLLEEKCGFRQLYYFPLACSMPDEDGNLEEVSPYILPQYSEQIQDAIEADQKRDIDTMAMYFWTHDQKVNDAIRAKLLTCDWGIEEIGGKLYGRVEVTAAEPFTPVEDRAMKDWISGQNSDGLGEGFEQRPIETVDGSIYVHVWNSGDEYFIVNADEIQKQLHPQTASQEQPQNEHPTLYGVGGGETAELHSVREVAQFIYEKGLHSDVHGEGVHLQAVVVMEAQGLVHPHPGIQPEARGFQTLPGTGMAGVENGHIVLLRHGVDGVEERSEILLGVDILLPMGRQ